MLTADRVGHRVMSSREGGDGCEITKQDHSVAYMYHHHSSPEPFEIDPTGLVSRKDTAYTYPCRTRL